MIHVTVTPKKAENLYGMLVKKEVELARRTQGTLYRSAGKKKGEEKWSHVKYKGWVRFQRCLGGVVVAQVQSRSPNEEWQFLTSFIGFLDRHFREAIVSIHLSYEVEDRPARRR